MFDSAGLAIANTWWVSLVLVNGVGHTGCYGICGGKVSTKCHFNRPCWSWQNRKLPV